MAVVAIGAHVLDAPAAPPAAPGLELAVQPPLVLAQF